MKEKITLESQNNKLNFEIDYLEKKMRYNNNNF